MSTVATYISSEEKLCIICKKLPESKNFYKCNMKSHIMCNDCYKQNFTTIVADRCMKCSSILKKIQKNPEVTVEDLFDLPADSVNRLLNRDGTNLGGKSQTSSFKPLKCPHRPCGRAISSMKSHYEREHQDIPKFLIKKGQQLKINTNVSIIEYAMTYCIAKLELYDEKVNKKTADTITRNKPALPLFWIFVSGSSTTNVSEAYALYWLVTESNEAFRCTLEMTSDLNKTGCAILCGVNNTLDDLSIDGIQKSMNCLYLSFGSISNIKGKWGEVNLNVTIH